MQKDDLNVHVFHYKNWCSPKSDRWFFSLTLTVRPYHRQDFKWKEIWVYGVNFWKNRSFACRTWWIYIYIYSVPMTKNHQIIRSRCFIDEFSFTDIFNDINHGHRAAILKKSFCSCFRFKCMWLLISIMKRCAERCVLQLYHTSLSKKR